MSKNLNPHWSGITAVIAFLYGILAAAKVYTNDPTAHSGAGILVMYFVLPVVFILVMGVTSPVLVWILIWAKNLNTRIGITLVAFGLFLFAYGVPSLMLTISAIFVFFIGYLYSKKASTDNEDLNKFL
jgi:hypothetical protein